jgi:hypothetical protein
MSLSTMWAYGLPITDASYEYQLKALGVAGHRYYMISTIVGVRIARLAGIWYNTITIHSNAHLA